MLGRDASLALSYPRIEVVDALASVEHYRRARAIQNEAFGMPASLDDVGDRWTQAKEDPTLLCLLALYDGEPAGAANAVMLDEGCVLAGGATREAMRGRGVFRALVAERWRRALDAGAAGVVVHAGRMSAPILRGLGFDTAAELPVYRDEGTAAGQAQTIRRA